MLERKKIVHSPFEVTEKKARAQNSKTRKRLKMKELALKKTAKAASTSDHHDNLIVTHAPSSRGK